MLQNRFIKYKDTITHCLGTIHFRTLPDVLTYSSGAHLFGVFGVSLRCFSLSYLSATKVTWKQHCRGLHQWQSVTVAWCGSSYTMSDLVTVSSLYELTGIRTFIFIKAMTVVFSVICLEVNSVLVNKASFSRVGYINFLFLLTECLARLGLKPVFVSAVGSDPLGVMMLKHCEEVKMVRFWVSFCHKHRSASTSSL